MKFSVKEGQKIFIAMHDRFVNRTATTFEGEITKVNTKSFYVKTFDRGTELRFDKRTGISEGFTCYYKAYPDKETYDSIIKRIEEEKQLKCDISETIRISELGLDDLLKIKEYIKKIIKDE